MSVEKFWWIMTGACVVWYSTVTIYVAIRGAFDIKTMLAHLAESAETVQEEFIDSPGR